MPTEALCQQNQLRNAGILSIETIRIITGRGGEGAEGRGGERGEGRGGRRRRDTLSHIFLHDLSLRGEHDQELQQHDVELQE